MGQPSTQYRQAVQGIRFFPRKISCTFFTAASSCSFSILRQLYQIAALYRLHNDHRLAKFPAHLIALPALYRGIVVIQIVELDLYHLDLGILRQDLLQHLRSVVEGNATWRTFPSSFRAKAVS